MKIIRKLYDWLSSKVYSPYAIYWLIFLFFIESVFFVPVDPLIILFCLNDRKRCYYYATVVTLASVAGGIFAYLLGAFMWNTIGARLVDFFNFRTAFNNAVFKYKLYQNWAVLIGGFMPVPYKAITLSAGFCKLPLLPFIICSLIARGARFFSLAIAIKIWGVKIQYLLDKYFNQFVIIFTILLILGVLVVII